MTNFLYLSINASEPLAYPVPIWDENKTIKEFLSEFSDFSGLTFKLQLDNNFVYREKPRESWYFLTNRHFSRKFPFSDLQDLCLECFTKEKTCQDDIKILETAILDEFKPELIDANLIEDTSDSSTKRGSMSTPDETLSATFSEGTSTHLNNVLEGAKISASYRLATKARTIAVELAGLPEETAQGIPGEIAFFATTQACRALAIQAPGFFDNVPGLSAEAVIRGADRAATGQGFVNGEKLLNALLPLAQELAVLGKNIAEQATKKS